MMLHFLYETVLGRMVLRVLRARGLSRLAGMFLDSGMSRCLIAPFIEKNNIPLEDYEKEEYRCFNDCFVRRIRPELRPIDPDPDHLISPCDGLLSAYRIEEDMVFPAKQSCYSVASLLRSRKLAARYEGGTCLVLRLCVNHYHRYCYLDDGVKSENRFIPGVLHTVRPTALENVPVFTENCREYTLLKTENFGTVAQIEIGAMLVGRICNHHGAGEIRRGQEKGMFQYGGSTIVLLLEKGKADLPEEYFERTAAGEETPVCMGQMLGTKPERK